MCVENRYTYTNLIYIFNTYTLSSRLWFLCVPIRTLSAVFTQTGCFFSMPRRGENPLQDWSLKLKMAFDWGRRTFWLKVNVICWKRSWRHHMFFWVIFYWERDRRLVFLYQSWFSRKHRIILWDYHKIEDWLWDEEYGFMNVCGCSTSSWLQVGNTLGLHHSLVVWLLHGRRTTCGKWWHMAIGMLFASTT